jgi:hypothetical protein
MSGLNLNRKYNHHFSSTDRPRAGFFTPGEHMPVTDVHEEKNTFSVDVNIPGHAARTTTPLFEKSRKHLLERDGGRCWVCVISG